MNPTPGTTAHSRIRSIAEEVFGPVRATPASPRHRLLLARSVLAYLGLVATLAQIVVWMMIGVVTAHLDEPWWLWTTVPAALGVAGLSLVDRWRGWYSAAQDSDEAAEATR